MRRRHEYILFPLVLSVAVHGVLLGGVLWGYSHELAALLQWRPGPNPPAAVVYLPDPQRPDRMGEMPGRGTAANAAPGDVPSQSLLAEQEQADLSRDPEGFGQVGDPPSRQIGPAGALAPLAPPGAPAPFGAAPSAAVSVMPAQPLRLPPKLIAMAAETHQSPPKLTPVPAASAAAPMAAQSPAVSPSLPAPQPADPLPESDSESDAFSNVGTVEVRNGRVEARFGRKVKMTRPRITFAGKFDQMSLDNPSMVLKVKTDATGKVTSVSVLRSSGSVDLDHPTEMAIYDWWIEPPRDKHGKPLPDVMVWTIAFR